MKRIIYYCFLVCSFLIINFQLKAQSDFTNILVRPISHNQTEPTITMDPMNSSHLFVGANVQYTYSEIGGYYSTSGINQWNGTDVLSLDNRYDPSAAYDLNHSLYYTYIKDNSKNSGYALDQQTYIIKSSNEGINFGSPKKLTASDYTGADKSFVAVDNYKNTNNVYVTWTDYSQGSLPKNDGGSNFNNYQISNQSFTPTPIPNANPGYMGDYIGIVSTNTDAYPCWMDNRTGTYQLYTADVQFKINVTADQKDANNARLTSSA